MDQRRIKNSSGKKQIISPRTISPTTPTKKKLIASILIYTVPVLVSCCSSSFGVASPLASLSSSSPVDVTFFASSSRFGRCGVLSLLCRSSTALSLVFDKGQGHQQHHNQSLKVHYHCPFVGRAVAAEPRLGIRQGIHYSSTTTQIMSSQQSISKTTTTTSTSEPQRMMMDISFSTSVGGHFDDGEFVSFKDAMEAIASKRNVMRDFCKNEKDLIVGKEHLLDNQHKLPQWGIAEFISLKDSASNTNNNKGGLLSLKKEDADTAVPYAKKNFDKETKPTSIAPASLHINTSLL